MKKTIQINIAGIAFNIEEDAFRTLNTYLESIKTYFSGYEGSDEIVADIEARIAEKFIGKNKPDALPIITETEVQEIMKSMGGVADFEAIEDETAFAAEPESSTNSSSANQTENPINEPKKRIFRDTKRKALGGVLAGLANYFKTDVVWFRVLFLIGFLGLAESGISGFLFLAYIICWIAFPANEDLEENSNVKKFYRNPEGKVVGGVASGLASYLNIDIAILRIIFVVLIPFFGIGILSYIILWIASPMAQTLTQKMEMKGEAVTIENIDSNIKQSLHSPSSGFRKKESAIATILLFPFRILGQLFQGLGKGLSHLGPFFRVVLGVMLCLLGLGLIVGSIGSTAVFYGLLTDHNWFTADHNLGFLARDLPANSGIFLFLMLAIPAFATLISGIILITNEKIGNRNFWLTGLGLWVVGVAGVSIIAGRYSLNYAKNATIKDTEKFNYAGEVLYLETYENLDDNTHDYNLKVVISETDEKEFEIEKSFTSSGATREAARQNATTLSYDIHQRDSILVFDERPVISDEASFRNQKVRVELKVPRNRKIHISKSFAQQLLANDWSVKSKYGINSDDFEKLLFVVNEEGELECLDCEPLDEKEQEAFRERERPWSAYSLDDDDFKPRGDNDRSYDLSDFNSLDVSSIFRVLVVQGTQYKVDVVAHDQDDLDDMELVVRNNTLKIDFRDRFFSDRNRVNVYVTMPELEDIELSGASKMKVIDFKSINRLDVNISGASNAQLDVEANKMNVDGSGASKIEIRGIIDQMDINLSGASKVVADKAEIQSARVEASGASRVELGEVSDLKSNTSGAASIHRD